MADARVASGSLKRGPYSVSGTRVSMYRAEAMTGLIYKTCHARAHDPIDPNTATGKSEAFGLAKSNKYKPTPKVISFSPSKQGSLHYD